MTTDSRVLGSWGTGSAWGPEVLTAAPSGAGLSRTDALSSQAANWQASTVHDNRHAALCSLQQADNWGSASWAP